MAGDTIIIGNWNDTTPAAPAGADNVKFQKDASSPPNISAYVPRADVAGTKYGTILYDGSGNASKYLGGDGAWHAVPAGSLPNGGTTGQVLAKASASDGDVAWINPAGGGGGLILLEEHNLSTSPPVAYVDFTNWLSSAYDLYEIKLVSCLPDTDNDTIYVRLSTDGGATFDSGNNYKQYGVYFDDAGGGDPNVAQNPCGYIFAQNALSNNPARGGLSGDISLFNPGSSVEYKRALGRKNYYGVNNSRYTATLTGNVYTIASPVNAFRVELLSGNFVSGVVRVYGFAGA